MTIDNGTATSPPSAPNSVPLEGSRKCPYCAPDRSGYADRDVVPDESDLLSRFLGLGGFDPGRQS